MRTVDEIVVRAPVDRCFRAGADVERWPELLPHYRWVRFHRRDAFGTGRVEMAAVRRFGPLPYPVWWVSEMSVDPALPAVRYRHVDGITTGMDVEWSFEEAGAGATLVRIVHEWEEGPRWPLPAALRRAVAGCVIGPVFIRRVASRTLRGIRRHLEQFSDQRESR
jgi:hypothetical protein